MERRLEWNKAGYLCFVVREKSVRPIRVILTRGREEMNAGESEAKWGKNA